MPCLIDIEVDVLEKRMSPHEAFKASLSRFRSEHPDSHPNVMADNAWGSFELIKWAREHGVHATLSMPKKTWPWLHEALAFGAPIESGRIAYIPDLQLLYSAYLTSNDRGELRTVKTLTSAFKFQLHSEGESEVSYVVERRKNASNRYEYHTIWSDGSDDWQPATSFMDEDGTFTNAWLEVADKNDVMDAICDLTIAELETICEAKAWKVLRLLYSCSPFLEERQ